MDILTLKFSLSVIAAIIIFYLLGQKYRVLFLTVLSAAFVASYSYILLGYILVYTAFNYFIGLKMPDSSNKLVLYRVGVIVNVSQLVLLKYASFAIDPVFQVFNSDIVISKLSEIIIPIGISYFTLQGIGYLINIKMGWEKPESSFFDLLLYFIFFPKFLSGPVERSKHFLPQLKSKLQFDEQEVSEGLKIALFGFFKKIAIANQLAPFIHGVYENLDAADGSSLWVLFLFQPLYLYFDFSGYTDIAIGFSKAFGINLLPNFNRPFFAENMTNFWKRFHISLSSWFNDYIFKQTVFKRRKWGVYASTYAVFLTFTLFGIWHGAGWNFMILGFLQAVAINYEFFTRKWRLKIFSILPDKVRIWIGRIFVYVFYAISMVFFFSPDLHATITCFKGLFTINESIVKVILLQIPLSAIILVIIYLAGEILQEDFNPFFEKMNHYWKVEKGIIRIFRWSVYSIILAILFVLGNQVQQFIYAQF